MDDKNNRESNENVSDEESARIWEESGNERVLFASQDKMEVVVEQKQTDKVKGAL